MLHTVTCPRFGSSTPIAQHRSTLYKMNVSGLVAALLLVVASAEAKWIVPGSRWLDTDGNFINAHGGNVLAEEGTGTFFWFGEMKTPEQEDSYGVSVYSSDDLATWESRGIAYRMYT